MTQIWDCTDARLSLGVYVLGAIDPAERSLADAHLVDIGRLQTGLDLQIVGIRHHLHDGVAGADHAADGVHVELVDEPGHRRAHLDAVEQITRGDAAFHREEPGEEEAARLARSKSAELRDNFASRETSHRGQEDRWRTVARER